MYKANDPKEGAGDWLKGLKQSQITSVKDSVNDIHSLIDSRKKLTQEILMDAERIKTEINNFILDLGDESNKAEQLNMRQKHVELEELKIQEKMNSWRDIATLKKELRDRVQELQEKETRASMLDTILEE